MWYFCMYVFITVITIIFSSQAMELNGEDLLGRAIRLDFARERGAYTPNDRYIWFSTPLLIKKI